MKYAHGVCCILLRFGHVVSVLYIPVIYVPISFRVALLALGQSHDCPSDSEVTLKDMGKTDHYQAMTKQ